MPGHCKNISRTCNSVSGRCNLGCCLSPVSVFRQAVQLGSQMCLASHDEGALKKPKPFFRGAVRISTLSMI